MTLAELIPSLRTSCYARLERGIWPDSAKASCSGGLAVGGVEITDIARRFGTPLYVLDTEHTRSRMLAYRAALPSAEIAYAGKALLTKALVRQAAEAGLSLDVCSGGEVGLAVAAGFPPERMLLHGNVKTDDELRLALDVGVGRIVLDSVDDIDRLGELARRPQRVMVRLSPAVDGQTHPALATGVEDQKFGVPIDQIDTVRRVGAYPTCAWWGCTATSGPRSRTSVTTSSRRSGWSKRWAGCTGIAARCPRSSISAAGMRCPTGKASRAWTCRPSLSGYLSPSQPPARSSAYRCRGWLSNRDGPSSPPPA